MKICKKISLLLAVFALLILSACSEEPEGSQETQQTEADAGEDATAGEETSQAQCAEGERINPITGDCIEEEVPDNDGDPDPEECDPGEVYDPITQACQSQCEDDEVYNSQTEQCETDQAPDCGLGIIQGQACAPSGQDLGQAMVSVVGEDCYGDEFEIVTQADADGFFTLYDVPAGFHQLYVASGSFSGQRDIGVSGGNTTELLAESDKVCVEGDELNIMVFQGFNENMQSLLDDLGIAYDTISSPGASTAELLGNFDALMEYDILFFECNHTYSSAMNHGDEAQILANMQDFVAQGNSIYSADNSYKWTHEPFPNLATFGGTTGSQIVQTDVMSSAMLTLLGTDTMEVDFDLSGMRVINEVHPPSQIHFRGERGSLPSAPLMYSYTEPINGGTVIYTSFHSSAQGTASEQILDVLSFLIFQL